MPAMNISLQRRIGKLPKSPDYLENTTPTIFGDSHRGYGSRVPTPISKGFFGIGKAQKKPLGNDMGDGLSTAWYGNDGVRSLPGPGIFGIGSAPGEETMMTSSMDNKPAHWGTPGLFGGLGDAQSFVTQNWVPIALVAGVMYHLRK